jgi:acetate kinase
MRQLRRLIEEGDEDAALAFDVYVHRLKKYVGAYLALLGRVDVVAFTAGVGENDARVRAAVCSGLEGLGIAVDDARNTARSGEPRIISPDWARTLVMVVPTMEELAIARQCVEAVEGLRPAAAVTAG